MFLLYQVIDFSKKTLYNTIMLKTERKKNIIEKSRVHESDTGSSEVQVSLVSQQIAVLADHLKKHAKDNHSRRGLLRMVAKRRTLLAYLAKHDSERYRTIIKKLGLKEIHGNKPKA